MSSRHNHCYFLFAVFLFSLVAWAGGARADQPPKGFPEGANCLFIGHSFFVPVAKVFDQIANQNEFPRHSAQFVFAGGKKGGPGALWNNPQKRKEIDAILKTGKIELFGMTVREATRYEDYVNWIEFALQYNPDTAFYIGVCWVPHGQKMPAEQFDMAINLTGQLVQPIVEKLREAYPDNAIYTINYGKTVSTMRAMFDDEQLDDITLMVDEKNRKNKKALFTDHRLGHAGPMMLELCALTWLELLYDADPTALKQTGYNAEDVKAITQKVRAFNDSANAKVDGDVKEQSTP